MILGWSDVEHMEIKNKQSALATTWYVGEGGKQPVTSGEDLRTVLLRQRGVSRDQAAQFFTPSFKDDIHDPLSLPGIEATCDRIFYAIHHGQHIVVYGDYDADGVTSTAILIETLQGLGATVSPFLPHRNEDGYGLRWPALERLAENMQLLISVDCGITSVNEVASLAERDIDTIIIDHHEPGDELPAAVAIVHPRLLQQQYPYPWLCGAGLAWKVATALLCDKRSAVRDNEGASKWLLDFTVLGTIADMVPLTGENRAIVHFGLDVLRRTQRPGLQALLADQKLGRQQLTVEDVSFNIISRLNAAGRMEHAQPALDLLLARTQGQAEVLLAEINSLNLKRQSWSRRVLKEAEALIDPSLPVIFLHNEAWPAGVVGIVAGRLVRQYGRPAIVVGGNGKDAVGSARAAGNTNILEYLQASKEHLRRLGGHARAAGFTVHPEAINLFREAVMQQAIHAPLVAATHEDSMADVVIGHDLLQQDTVYAIEKFGPFGEGNKKPRFIIRDLPLVDWRPVGKSANHAKCTFWSRDEALDGIGFDLVDRLTKDDCLGKKVDVLGELEENVWRGRRTLQLAIKDIARAGRISIKEHGEIEEKALVRVKQKTKVAAV